MPYSPKTHGFKGRERHKLPAQMRIEQFDDPIMFTIGQTSVTPCQPKYFRTFCSCKKRVHQSGCRKNACPTCSEEILKRRSIRIFKRFQKNRCGRPVLYTTFTVPLQLRAKYGDRVEWRRLVKAVVSLMKGYGLEFAVEQSHPISEEFPHRFHPHINLLWIQKPGFKAQFTIAELSNLRAAWKDLLEWESESDVNLYHEYTSRNRIDKKTGELISENVQIKHLCNYVLRPFPDFSTWVGSIRWYGKIPKMKKEIHVCPDCHSVYVLDGFADKDEWVEYCMSQLKPGQKARPGPALDDFLPNWN